VSYLCLATAQFDRVFQFYREVLAFPMVREWDRPNARGALLDLNGLRLELLDAMREQRPFALHPPGDRLHVVVEVPDVDAVYRSLALELPEPTTASWGARWFVVRDPDGVPLSFVQWIASDRSNE